MACSVHHGCTIDQDQGQIDMHRHETTVTDTTDRQNGRQQRYGWNTTRGISVRWTAQAAIAGCIKACPN